MRKLAISYFLVVNALVSFQYEALSQGAEVTYDLVNGSIAVVGEKTFTSLNKKVDEFQSSRDDPDEVVSTNGNLIRLTDMMPLDVRYVLRLHTSVALNTNNGYGIIGDVTNGTSENDDNPPNTFPTGNGIFFTLYAYDDSSTDGLGDILYQGYITDNATSYENHFLKKTSTSIISAPRYSSQIRKNVISYLKKKGSNWKYWDNLVIPVVAKVKIKNATLKQFNILGLNDEHFGTFFRVENDKKMFLNPRAHDGYIQFASHRGTLRQYPENSLPAINESLQNQEIDQIEIDCDLTRDKEIVLLHKAKTMSRYTNSTKPVRQTSWEDVKNLYYKDRMERLWDGNNGTQALTVQRLQDVLPSLKDRMMIHMDKVEDYIDKVMDISEPLKMTHQMIFKGKASPGQLYDRYVTTDGEIPYDNRYGNILEKINYLPICFTFDNTRQLKAADVGLSTSATWQQIIDQWLVFSNTGVDGVNLSSCIRGFETQWFTDFRFYDIELIEALPHIKTKNVNILSSPMFVEDYPGLWIPSTVRWMRFNPNRDFRYNYDFWYDQDPDNSTAPNPGSEASTKTLPDMIIGNGEYRLLPYLEDRNHRTLPTRFQ